MDLNRLTVMGNLTRDPEAKSTANGQKLTCFTVATNRAWKDTKTKARQDATEFHNVLAWGKLAGVCEKYLSKGRRVYVEGRVQTNQWEDKDKIKRNKTELVASQLIMLGKSSTKAAEAAEEITVEDETPDNEA